LFLVFTCLGCVQSAVSALSGVMIVNSSGRPSFDTSSLSSSSSSIAPLNTASSSLWCSVSINKVNINCVGIEIVLKCIWIIVVALY
jgi:hypothetical protein